MLGSCIGNPIALRSRSPWRTTIAVRPALIAMLAGGILPVFDTVFAALTTRLAPLAGLAWTQFNEMESPSSPDVPSFTGS